MFFLRIAARFGSVQTGAPKPDAKLGFVDLESKQELTPIRPVEQLAGLALSIHFQFVAEFSLQSQRLGANILNRRVALQNSAITAVRLSFDQIHRAIGSAFLNSGGAPAVDRWQNSL